jgi:hypothetical protein
MMPRGGTNAWRDVVQLLGLAAGVLYGLGWIFVARFFGEPGVSPEEVGVDWLWVLVRVGIAAVLVATVLALATLAVRFLGVRVSDQGGVAVSGWPAILVLAPIGWLLAKSGLGSAGVWVSLVLFVIGALVLAPELAGGVPRHVGPESDAAGEPESGAAGEPEPGAAGEPEPDAAPEPSFAPPSPTSDGAEAGEPAAEQPRVTLGRGAVLFSAVVTLVAALLLTLSLASTWGSRVVRGERVSVELLPGLPVMQIGRVELSGRGVSVVARRDCTMLLGRANGVIVLIAFSRSRAAAGHDGTVRRLDASGLDLRSRPGSCVRS